MSENPQLSAFSSQPSAKLLEHFRASKHRLPLHPLEKAVLAAVAVHLCFLPWALGTMHPWSQITSLVLSTLGLLIALIPRTYSGDYLPVLPPQAFSPAAQRLDESRRSFSVGGQSQVSAMRLTAWPRLLKFPIFWIGLALLGYLALQALNPSWVWERNERTWWLRRVNDIPWLPTSIDTPFERFNIWRQFIIYAAAWLTVCTAWIGFTRRRSLQLLLLTLVINGMLLAIVGFAQRFTASSKFLFFMEWPVGHTAFASFIYRNHAGAYLALMTGIAVSLAIWTFTQGERAGRKSTPAGLLFFCAVFLTTAVFFSLSRGASLLLMIAWLAVAAWFWISQRRSPTAGGIHRGVYAAITLLFLVVIGITVKEVNVSSIQSRFTTLFTDYNNRYESVQWRVKAHAAANSMLADYWQRGVGAGGFRYLYPEYIKKYPGIYNGGQLYWEHAHSDWREIPIELGAAGTLLLLLGGGWWLLFFLRSGRPPVSRSGQPNTQVSGFFASVSRSENRGQTPGWQQPATAMSQPSVFWHSLAVPVLIGCSQTLAHAWFDFPFQSPAILATWCALITISARWIELDSSS